MAILPPKVLNQRKRELKALLKKHNGSVLKAAKATRVTPQAIYSRMKTYGVEIRRTLKGEPRQKSKKKIRMQNLLNQYRTPGAVAKHLGVHVNTVRNRMSMYHIKYWLAGLLEQKGSAQKVARFLGISSAAVYDRMRRYGLYFVE